MCVGREYRSRFASEDTVSFCLRVMVGVIILYDYVHPVGAFAKSSKIDVSMREAARALPPPFARSLAWKLMLISAGLQMKGCIKVLKDQPPNTVDGLLNALR